MSTAMYFLIIINMLVCIFFANKLFVLNEKKSVFLPLAGCFLANTLLGYLEIQILTVKHIETAQSLALNYMISVTWVIYLSILSSISFRFPKKKYGQKSKVLKLISSIPIVFLTFTFLFSRYLDHVNLSMVNEQWHYQFDFTDPVGFIFMAFICCGVFILSWFYWRQYFLQAVKKREPKIIWLGVIQSMASIGGIFFFIFFTQHHHTPFIASLAISVCLIFITWIFTDFKLDKISASIAFNDILDSMSSILIITNKQLEIIEINSEGASKLCLSKKEIYGLPLHKLIKKLKVENWKSMADLILKSKKDSTNSVISKIRVENKDYFISVNVKPHYDKRKKLVGYIFLGSDVTEIKTQKNEIQNHTKILERTNKELERFAYIASHDLKTPLRSVVSFLDLIERKIVKYEDKDLREFVYLARQGASQMHHLISDILEFSRVDKIGKTAEQVDLNETLLKICYQLQPEISEKKGQIQVSELPSIRAEKTHMLQLFSNLIENGFKYNDRKSPKVKVNHRKENDRHIFAISDNGIGVEPQYFDQIFEMFKRLHTNPDHEGSGIGLSICKKIVDLYQGEIWLESKINEGTTFFFTLAEQD